MTNRTFGPWTAIGSSGSPFAPWAGMSMVPFQAPEVSSRSTLTWSTWFCGRLISPSQWPPTAAGSAARAGSRVRVRVRVRRSRIGIQRIARMTLSSLPAGPRPGSIAMRDTLAYGVSYTFRRDLPGLILPHLAVERSQGVDLVRGASEPVGGVEVLIAAGPPEAPPGIDDQRVADASPEDRGAVGARVHGAGPGALLRVGRHEVFDLAHEPREELGTLAGRSRERRRDGPAQHRIGRRGEDAGLEVLVRADARLPHSGRWDQERHSRRAGPKRL